MTRPATTRRTFDGVDIACTDSCRDQGRSKTACTETIGLVAVQ